MRHRSVSSVAARVGRERGLCSAISGGSMLEILFGKALSAIIEHLLPSPEMARYRDKRTLGRRLLRIAWLLEDFSDAFGRLQVALREIGVKDAESFMHYLDQRFNVKQAFDHLNEMIPVLEKDLAELKYLKLFDRGFYKLLIRAFDGEAEVRHDLGDLLLHELGSMGYAMKVDRCKLRQEAWLHVGAGPQPVLEPQEQLREIDISKLIGSGELLDLIAAVAGDVESCSTRMGTFIREHFTVEELFPVRNG